mgnify:FL=1
MTERGKDTYLLGMAPDEIARLERQHEIWRQETERTFDDLAIVPGMTLLDLGCGPGFTTIDLHDRLGSTGRVVGVDRSEEATGVLRQRVEQEGRSGLEVITADVLDVDYRSIDPDILFARWLFSFLPDPEEVIGLIATSLRAGSRIAIIDYWNYGSIHCEPTGPHFAKIFRRIHASYADSGGSLDIGGALPGIMVGCGVRPITIRSVGGATRSGTPYWDWITTFLHLYLPSLVAKDYLTQQEIDEFLAWWSRASEDPATILNLPPMVAIIGEVEG